MASSQKKPTLVLGVTGGIACYKAVELVRLLVKDGFVVQVIMTRGAMEFVTPLTFQTLSGMPVASETLNLTQESEIGHINLADKADLFVIAPATANVIGKIAAGIADDLLTTVLMATQASVLIAPAMNIHMAKQAEAERERRAKVIHADGEFQASQKLADAAEVMSKQPTALQLRYLQSLVEIASEKNSTTIFPIPIDLLTPFLKKSDPT